MISWVIISKKGGSKKGGSGGGWLWLPILPRMSFILFYNSWEIFVVLNPTEKHREKQCFIIFGSFSHILTEKLIFSQKAWERHQIWLLVAFDAIKLHFWCFTYIKSVDIKRPLLFLKWNYNEFQNSSLRWSICNFTFLILFLGCSTWIIFLPLCFNNPFFTEKSTFLGVDILQG